MSRVIIITGWFDVLDQFGSSTGKKEFLVSHGIDQDTGKNVILPNEHPLKLGAVLDDGVVEWVLEA